MAKAIEEKINPVINVAQTVFDENVDEYLKQKHQGKLLYSTEEELYRSLLTLLGVIPETDKAYYREDAIPTVSLSETLLVTIYQNGYCFERQNPETEEIDFHTTISDDDIMFDDVKREMDVIYPTAQNSGKQKIKL